MEKREAAFLSLSGLVSFRTQNIFLFANMVDGHDGVHNCYGTTEVVKDEAF